MNNSDTFNEMIDGYLTTIGHKLIYRREKIQFIYNGQQIKFGKYTTVGQLFPKE